MGENHAEWDQIVQFTTYTYSAQIHLSTKNT